jgi:hypothetical protein
VWLRREHVRFGRHTRDDAARVNSHDYLGLTARHTAASPFAPTASFASDAVG